MNPLGPPDPRPPGLAFQALFRRNALRPPDQEELHVPEDRAELHRSEERLPKRDSSVREEKEEKPQKKYRTPSFPLPPMPAPRQPRAQGFLMAPSPQTPRKQGREMKEGELGGYSRWRAREATPGGPLWIDDSQPEGDSPDQDGHGQGDDPLQAMLCDPQGTRGRDRLVQWLHRFGPRVLESCWRFGLTIQMVAQGPWGFDPAQKRLQAQLEQLDDFPEETLLGMAQAYDWALGGGTPASRSAVAVLAAQPEGDPETFFAGQLVEHLFRGQGGPLTTYLQYLVGSQGSPDSTSNRLG